MPEVRVKAPVAAGHDGTEERVNDVLSVLMMSAALLAQDTGGLAAADGVSEAVTLEDYSRDYEEPKSEAERQYDSNIWSAYSAKIGQMEGAWVVSSGSGALVALELRREAGGDLEGAWRSMQGGSGVNGSGFVSNIALTNNDLEINYFQGRSRSPTILHLRKQADGSWRGTQMDVMGRKTMVTMTRSAGS